jgi:hypothetical protein
MLAYFIIVATIIRMVGLGHMHLDFLVQSIRKGFTRDFEIVPRLEIHPELGLHPQKAAQAQRCIRGNPPLPMDNLINATRRYPDRLRQMVLADLHRLQKILKQDLPRMDRRKVALCHLLPSVIVNNFYIIGITVTPDKADAPLIVHPYAMLSLAIMGQRLKSIARWHA